MMMVWKSHTYIICSLQIHAKDVGFAIPAKSNLSVTKTSFTVRSPFQNKQIHRTQYSKYNSDFRQFSICFNVVCSNDSEAAHEKTQ
jgi:hypothetical protein